LEIRPWAASLPAVGRQVSHGLIISAFSSADQVLKRLWDLTIAFFVLMSWKMLRQEIMACQKCGSLKELGDDFDCPDEKERSLETKDHNHGKK
jgi:hypothetical protein